MTHRIAASLFALSLMVGCAMGGGNASENLSGHDNDGRADSAGSSSEQPAENMCTLTQFQVCNPEATDDPTQCCSGSLRCLPGGSRGFICRAPFVELGRSCTADGECIQGACTTRGPGTQKLCLITDETTACTSDHSCGGQASCVAGQCVRPAGATCDRDALCESGICDDGVCDLPGSRECGTRVCGANEDGFACGECAGTNGVCGSSGTCMNVSGSSCASMALSYRIDMSQISRSGLQSINIHYTDLNGSNSNYNGFGIAPRSSETYTRFITMYGMCATGFKIVSLKIDYQNTSCEIAAPIEVRGLRAITLKTPRFENGKCVIEAQPYF